MGSIAGENYPPPAFAQVIGTVVGYGQVLAVALMLLGPQLLQAVGVAGTPRWLVWMRNNKVAVFFLAFAASQVAARLTATGAFEVFYDGVLVFSKLQEGRLPTMQELHDVIALVPGDASF